MSKELAEELLKAHKFRSHADAAVVVERAAAALRELEAENELQRQQIWNYCGLMDDLRARIESLEAALLRYGQHEQGCRHGETTPDAVCTCGLEAAIDG